MAEDAQCSERRPGLASPKLMPFAILNIIAFFYIHLEIMLASFD